MVELKPFRGVYYNKDKVEALDRVVTPPFDVISKEDQERYYRNSKYNVVRLILGKTLPSDSEKENWYTRAKKLLNKWLEEGVLIRDPKPAIYAYEQEFTLENGSTKKQLGFIALVKIEPFEKKIILPHERIVSRMKEDRLNLMKACRANMSLIITAYSDRELRSNRMLKEKTRGKPFIEVSFGRNHCVHRVWVIHDKDFIDEFVPLFREKRLYIADGHHRYTTALEYHTRYNHTPSSEYMMMFLLNMENDGVTILPAHRVMKGLSNFDLEDVKKKLREFFDLEEYEKEDAEEFFDRLEKGRNSHCFGMYGGDGRLILLKLRNLSVMDELTQSMPKIWRKLDVIVLHQLVIGKVLGVDADALIDREDLVFVKERSKVLSLVDSEEFQVAFFLNPTKMQQVKEVAKAGERMPQKSTYFYPKPLSGLIINKLE